MGPVRVDDSELEETRGTPAMARAPVRRVFVSDLELVASVGIFEVERRYEQRIVISLDLDVLDDYDGASDRIEDVLDYGAIVKAISRIAGARHYNLIETLAERIAEACLGDARVCEVRVSIAKPDVLPQCRAVGVTITRRRV